MYSGPRPYSIGHPGPSVETPPAIGGAESRLAAHLEGMRSGDRRAVALFIAENRDLIRRRFRKKIPRSARCLFDSQDLLSTMARRLDRIVLLGTLKAATVDEFWSLVMALGRFSLSEHARDATRHRDFRDLESIDDVERSTPAGAEGGDGLEEPSGVALLNRCLARLNDDVDATVLVLRLGGLSHAQVARHLGSSGGAVRKRWERIRAALRDLEKEQWTPS